MSGPYYFADLSHHKKRLNMQTFADAGHRISISKASDNYYLPDQNGKYTYTEDWHVDSFFVENYVNARSIGLGAGAYHFVRFDRPVSSNVTTIVDANLRYFMDAISRLPPIYQDEVVTGILDIEQSGAQLKAAGFSPKSAKLQDMTKSIVTIFEQTFDHLILYAGSWWTDEWLTTATTEWMAERMAVWEPEYVYSSLINDNKPPNVNFQPSVPKGFSNEYATMVSDMVGKLFAWQFTAGGRYPGIAPNIDTNLTFMPKDELFILFGDGAVDPPEPPQPPVNWCCDEVIEDLGHIHTTIENLIDYYQNK